MQQWEAVLTEAGPPPPVLADRGNAGSTTG